MESFAILAADAPSLYRQQRHYRVERRTRRKARTCDGGPGLRSFYIAVLRATVPELSGEIKGTHTEASNVTNTRAVRPADNGFPMLTRVLEARWSGIKWAMQFLGWIMVLSMCSSNATLSRAPEG